MIVNHSFVTTARALSGFIVAILTLFGAVVPMTAVADGGNASLVHACVDRRTQVRIVGPSDACDPGERSMHWVLSGPEGPAPQPGPTSCPAGTANCGAGCVNVTTDVRNCGACGRACQQGQACTAGTCQNIGGACPAGTANCGGGCANIVTDTQNCGACGVRCAPGAACVNGACRMTTCPAGMANCGAGCVNVVTDVRNCGACGRACQPGQACTAGVCR